MGLKVLYGSATLSAEGVLKFRCGGKVWPDQNFGPSSKIDDVMSWCMTQIQKQEGAKNCDTELRLVLNEEVQIVGFPSLTVAEYMKEREKRKEYFSIYDCKRRRRQ